MAHLVLVCLAVYADRNGSARPSLATLADDARLATERAAKEALARLVAAGLVAPAGDFNGTTIWRLNTSATRGDDELTVAQTRRETARRKHAERARRYRERQTPSRLREGVPHAPSDAEVRHDVTPNQSVTNGSVTLNLDARDAEVERHVTPKYDARDAGMTVTTAGHTGRNSDSELPIELPRTQTSPATHSDAFDRFWAAYPKKVARKVAERAFEQTVRKGHPADTIVVEAERWAALWTAEGREQRYIPNAATWLNGERWTDAPPPPRAANGHPAQRPSTTDQRIATAQALKQRFADHPSNRPQLTSGGQP